MPSVNEWLVDEAIRHQVDFSKYSNNVVRRIMAVLHRSDARLYQELTAALERMDPASFTVERLESMLYSVRSVNTEAFTAVRSEITTELQSFVEYESAYQRQALISVLPVQVHVAEISAGQIYAAAMARPFQGVILNSVLADLEAGAAKKIRQTIAQGFIEGRTTAQIIKDLRGTKAKGYEDGLMAGSRRDIEAVARTALGHMAGFTQDKFVEANLDLIKAVQWSSTLDLRTTKICRPRDSKLYTPDTHKPIGHSLPWLGGPGRAHWRCRSHQVSVLKSNKELGIESPDVVMPDGTRASMDGQLPKETTYGQWLEKQSAARQIEVLGPIRAALMRKGGLSLDRMYSQKGQYLTLEELRRQDAAAFRRAGL